MYKLCNGEVTGDLFLSLYKFTTTMPIFDQIRSPVLTTGLDADLLRATFRIGWLKKKWYSPPEYMSHDF